MIKRESARATGGTNWGLEGKQLQAREIAELVYDAGWQDAQALVVTVAVCLAESDGFERAWHDNADASGQVTSRDVGLFQINIPATKIGTDEEEQLYDPATNVARAFDLYTRREWQPWVAFNTGVYLHDSYIARAVRGVGNYLHVTLEALPNPDGYESKLTSPLLGMMWWTPAMGAVFSAIEGLAKEALASATSPLVRTKLDQIISDARSAHNIAKKALPPS